MDDARVMWSDAGLGGLSPMDAAQPITADAKLVRPVPSSCKTDDYDVDYDGLSAADERDGGFDPCRSDSDSDGCEDAFELAFGGCDPRHAVSSQCSWYYAQLDGVVRFTVPASDAGRWSLLALQVDPGVLVQAKSTSDSQATRQGDAFRNVAPGAEVSFEVSFERPVPGGRANVTLVDERGVALDRGTVLYLMVQCPIVI